jgi:sporulation protein YlmC with PRC-barrel domain
MTDTRQQGWEAWIGHQIIDTAGDKVGKVSQVYFDEQSGQPEWLAVNTGMFSSKASFVPLQGAKADGENSSSASTRPRSRTPPVSRRTPMAS